VTTDAEIEEALKLPKSREWLISAFLETSERRSQLAVHMMKDFQHRLDFVIVKRRRWAEGGYGVKTQIREMERLDQALDGTETLDLTRFKSLLSDLRALNAEQKG